MYLSIFICLLLSLTISSINGSNRYLDNLDTLDFSQYPNEQNYENKQNEKSYLEKLEEKIKYENELSKLEELLTSKEYSNDNQENDPKTDDIDEYLKYQSTNLLPAFDSKELNNQKINLPESSDYLKDINHLNHYLTTMPTELRNKLMSGERLRRVYKKSPILQSVLFENNYPNEELNNQLEENEEKKTNINDEIKDEKNENNFEDNLNKEIDLEELTKYLMAKRTQIENLTDTLPKNTEKQNDSNSDSKSLSNSSKESDDNSKESKENDSKESKESKDSSDSSQTKEKEPPLNNISTELKKTIITQQNGKAIKKVETYKKSYFLSKPNFMNDDESNSYLINPPIDANYEKILHEENMQKPILINQRNSLDRYENGQFIKTKSRISFGDIYFIGIVVACSMVSILSVAGAGYCFYRFQQHNKATQDVEYPAYGIIGPAFKSPQDDDSSPKTKKNPLTQESLVNKATNINHQSILSQDAINTGSDRKLAQSAQMYHYHHQKQQMILTEKNKNMRNTSASDVETDEENEENEEGDYTVYECPGLATNLGEIEITNPNFQHENIDEKTNEKKSETDSKK